MKEVLVKLQGRDEEDNKDLSKWRRAKCDEIYTDNMIRKEQEYCISAGIIDQLFSFEETRIVYLDFVRSDGGPLNETCNSHLIRFDVVSTDSFWLSVSISWRYRKDLKIR